MISPDESTGSGEPIQFPILPEAVQKGAEAVSQHWPVRIVREQEIRAASQGRKHG